MPDDAKIVVEWMQELVEVLIRHDRKAALGAVRLLDHATKFAENDPETFSAWLIFSAQVFSVMLEATLQAKNDAAVEFDAQFLNDIKVRWQ